LRDRHGLRPFAAADLVFGVYDVDGTPSVRNWGERVLVLSRPIMQWFGDHFVPAELRKDPDVSPIYADLSGMPPALFTVGTMDPLIDDTLFMHARWVGAGNEAELGVYPGGSHGFTGFPIGIGKKARDAQDAFFKKHLG
jgi:acetyl esterase/lipase